MDHVSFVLIGSYTIHAISDQIGIVLPQPDSY